MRHYKYLRGVRFYLNALFNRAIRKFSRWIRVFENWSFHHVRGTHPDVHLFRISDRVFIRIRIYCKMWFKKRFWFCFTIVILRTPRVFLILQNYFTVLKWALYFRRSSILGIRLIFSRLDRKLKKLQGCDYWWKGCLMIFSSLWKTCLGAEWETTSHPTQIRLCPFLKCEVAQNYD